jgi:hypothetical protein
MPDTASLALPLLVAEQAQKHVTHNEALRLIDALVQMRVVEQGLTTPPGSPSDGDIYIPGSGATGAWSAWDFNLAHCLDGGWRKIVPKVGWIVYDIDQAGFFMYVGAPLYWTRLVQALGVRQQLTANRTYFVNGAGGSDANSGLTSGSAFATIQKAIDTVGGLDVSIHDVTISVASGTYTAALTLKNFVGGGKCTITCPSGSATISVTGANAIFGSGIRSRWYLGAGLKVQTTTSGSGVYMELGAINLEGLEFGACASSHLVLDSTLCFVRASYAISGNASRHALISTGSQLIYSGGLTVTLTGTPNFSRFIEATKVSVARVIGITFSGSATGTRYLVNTNSVIDTNGGGASYLPGDAAGSTATGGQYV